MNRPPASGLLLVLPALVLLILATTFSNALILTSLFLWIALPAAALRRCAPSLCAASPPLCNTVLLIVSATLGCTAELLLAAFAGEFYAAMHGYVPVVIFCAYGFAVQGELAESRSLVKPTLQIVAALLITGLVREIIGTGVILALTPCALLIGTGLIVAAFNYLHPNPPGTHRPDTKNRRVRVTGPIS